MKNGMTWRNGGIALSGTRTRWKFGGENSRNESLRWPLARLPYSNMGWSIGALNVAQCAGRGDKMGMHEANKQELKMERAIKEDQRQRDVFARRTATGFAMANLALERRNDLKDRPHVGQLLQRALGRGAERMGGNVDVQVETWEQTCAALRMTSKRSLCQCDRVGANVASHGCLPRRQTPYLRVVVMTGAQDPH